MLRSRQFLTLAALVLIGLLSALDHAGVFGYRGNDRLRYDHAESRVVGVVDATTVEVDIPDAGMATTRVRLLGLSRDGEIATSETLAPQAKGRAVRLVLDPNHRTRDEAGNLLAYVYLGDGGEMLNEDLIRCGAAHADAAARHVMHHRFGELAARAGKTPAPSRE